jgi:hypothetical protein
MRTDVRKVVDANAESACHVAQRAPDRAVVLLEVPITLCVPAAENDVHRAARADGALQFPTAAPDGATVLGSPELAPQLSGKEQRLLHGKRM